MTPPPRAILFDLDDTILDTTLSATRVWQRTAAAFAGEIGRPAAEIDAVLDRARVWYWSDPDRNAAGRLDVRRSRIDVTHHGLLDLGIDDPDLAQRFAGYYSDHRVDTMRPFDGALATLEHFCDAGVPMALLTNGDAAGQREKVEAFGLARYFRAMLIEGELGFGKPDERVYARALSACGVVPSRAVWCVGDSLTWEVARPQALGLTGIWVDWEGVGLPDDSDVRPDRRVRRIAELRDPPPAGQ